LENLRKAGVIDVTLNSEWIMDLGDLNSGWDKDWDGKLDGP
jgi:hypothetical protein